AICIFSTKDHRNNQSRLNMWCCFQRRRLTKDRHCYRPIKWSKSRKNPGLSLTRSTEQKNSGWFFPPRQSRSLAIGAANPQTAGLIIEPSRNKVVQNFLTTHSANEPSSEQGDATTLKSPGKLL